MRVVPGDPLEEAKEIIRTLEEQHEYEQRELVRQDDEC